MPITNCSIMAVEDVRDAWAAVPAFDAEHGRMGCAGNEGNAADVNAVQGRLQLPSATTSRGIREFNDTNRCSLIPAVGSTRAAVLRLMWLASTFLGHLMVAPRTCTHVRLQPGECHHYR